MKGRLNQAIWTLGTINAAALLAVLYFAYSAGSHANGLGIGDAMSAPGETPKMFLAAVLVALSAAMFVLFRLSNKVAKPVSELVNYSQKFSNGEYNSRPHIEGDDDFAVIAENFTRTSERISRAVHNHEAQEALQKSVTDFLTVVSQIARGDLTLRGRVTNDALGNVVDSVNYMLDNFAKVLERVRKAAVDRERNSALLRRHGQRRCAAGPGNHEYVVCRGRADRLDEAGVEQRGSFCGSGTSRSRCRGAGKPFGPRHAGRNAAHSCIGAG